MQLAITTRALIEYLQSNDKINGFALDEARMLARDAATPVDPTPQADAPRYSVGFATLDRKHEVVCSRIADTFSACQDGGFDQSSDFRALWDDVVLAAIADGYPVATIQ